MTTTTSSSPLLSPLLGGAPDASPFLWKSGAVLVFTGMVAGAFGAHGLENRTGITPHQLEIWGRASTYAMINGLGLMLVSMHRRFAAHRFAGPAILTGGVLFSGSILGLVLVEKRHVRFLGPVTPLGGLIMMAGYLSLAL